MAAEELLVSQKRLFSTELSILLVSQSVSQSVS
jgi:hypothetical protein